MKAVKCYPRDFFFPKTLVSFERKHFLLGVSVFHRREGYEVTSPDLERPRAPGDFCSGSYPGWGRQGGRGRVPVPGFQASAQRTWAETSGSEVGGHPLAPWPFADLPVPTRCNPHSCNIQGQLLSRNRSFVTFTQVCNQHLSLSLEHFLPHGRPRVDTPGAPAATGMNSSPGLAFSGHFL